MADWWASHYCLAVKFFAFTQSPSFLPSPQKLTFIFGRRVASSDWSNWSKWAASPWCTVSGEIDGRKWSEWCGATASGKKAVKLDAIGPKPCPWWPSAKQVECPSWLCWPVRSETKLPIADFRAMLERAGFFEKLYSTQLHYPLLSQKSTLLYSIAPHKSVDDRSAPSAFTGSVYMIILQQLGFNHWSNTVRMWRNWQGLKQDVFANSKPELWAFLLNCLKAGRPFDGASVHRQLCRCEKYEMQIKYILHTVINYMLRLKSPGVLTEAGLTCHVLLMLWHRGKRSFAVLPLVLDDLKTREFKWFP